MDDREAREKVGRIEGLLEEVETLPDPVARARATDAVEALLDLYGEGLARIVDGLGPERAAALAGDELVSHLLLVHGLHPVPLEQRVQSALDEVRPYLSSHGGRVELASLGEDGVVRVRLAGSCDGCPSSASTLKLAVEEAVLKAAPEMERVEAEGGLTPPATASPAPTGIPLPMAVVGGGNGAAPAPASEWAVAGGLPQLANGGTVVTPVAGDPLLFLSLDDTYYAYRPGCPGCGGSLEGAGLEGAELSCPGCGHRYDARRAGRCLDEPRLHLDPLPLLVGEDGLVRVALGAVAA